ncbi:hypothetical protein Tco_1099848, partial [Tanacetum coccineum]
LGKFDGKSDEGFFVGYSLSSKAFRVYNTRTRRVEENLHIGFLENKPMIEGNGPKWLFDINTLTQSMNYVPIAAGTITNEFASKKEEFNAGTSTQKEEISQDCIVMPIWKVASYFDSPSKNVGNGEPKSADDQKQVEDGPDNENVEKDKSEDDSSPKEVNTAGQHVNIASLEVNIGSFKLNIVDPSVCTASLNDTDSPKDMFKMGASHTLEATHVEFFSDEDEPEVVLEKPLVKDGDADDVDVHLYRSMIGSLIYLTTSRPDIMFVVCACARFQVTPKTSHLLAVKRIFRYLKHKPTLGLWYSRDSPFELVAYTDSDYVGATQDRKSTTRVSEYVAAASRYLLTKGFDAGRFQYLVSSIGMLNP